MIFANPSPQIKYLYIRFIVCRSKFPFNQFFDTSLHNFHFWLEKLTANYSAIKSLCFNSPRASLIRTAGCLNCMCSVIFNLFLFVRAPATPLVFVAVSAWPWISYWRRTCPMLKSFWLRILGQNLVFSTTKRVQYFLNKFCCWWIFVR